MMKHLFTRNLYGGLGLEDLTIGGHIGLDGTQAVAMEAMDITEAAAADIHTIGEDQDLGVVAVEEHTLADSVAQVAVAVVEEVAAVEEAGDK